MGAGAFGVSMISRIENSSEANSERRVHKQSWSLVDDESTATKAVTTRFHSSIVNRHSSIVMGGASHARLPGCRECPSVPELPFEDASYRLYPLLDLSTPSHLHSFG